MGDIAQLLNTFSLNTVIIIVAAVISIGYSASKIRDYLKAKTDAVRAAQRNRIEQENMIKNTLALQDESLKELKENQKAFMKNLQKISSQINLLVSSDMADIKSYITERYNEFIALGHIDMHSLESCQKRYEYYKLEGGNSFVQQLMNELRNLPIK